MFTKLNRKKEHPHLLKIKTKFKATVLKHTNGRFQNLTLSTHTLTENIMRKLNLHVSLVRDNLGLNTNKFSAPFTNVVDYCVVSYI